MYQKKYYQYIKMYIIFLIILTIPFILNYVFLKNCGEFLSNKDIFNLQNNKEKITIYGSALFNISKEFKLFFALQKKPQIITIGSSRVLQFRNSFFTKTFYNMGSTMSSVHNGLDVASLLITKHRPEIVLFGIDFWWFNDDYIKPDYHLKTMTKSHNSFDLGHILVPFKILKSKQITINDYIKVLSLPQNPHIGVFGKLMLSGLGSDGSYYYTNTIIGHNTQIADQLFKNTISSIENGTDTFQHNSLASELHFKKFLELVQTFEKHKIKVILFLPPLAPTVNKKMKNFNYAYIEHLKENFLNHQLKVYDFTNPEETLATNDCEFIDGFHGGDVIYAKILDYLNSREPTLRQYVNNGYLKNVILKYSDLAMIPDQRITQEQEVDFLCLGCKKSTFSMIGDN